MGRYFACTDPPKGTATTCLSAVDVAGVDAHLASLLLEQQHSAAVAGRSDGTGPLSMMATPRAPPTAQLARHASVASTASDGAGAALTVQHCLVLFETHLMSPSDKASLLRRALAADVNVVFVAPFLDAADMRIVLADGESGTLNSRVVVASVLHASTPTRMYVVTSRGRVLPPRLFAMGLPCAC